MSELPPTNSTVDLEAAVRQRYGGTGKIDVAAARIGVDMNDDMLAFARGAAPEVDDSHVLGRGGRTAVCEKTFGAYAREPSRGQLDLVQPYVHVPLTEAPPLSCAVGTLRRDPRETKGDDDQLTTDANSGKLGDCG